MRDERNVKEALIAKNERTRVLRVWLEFLGGDERLGRRTRIEHKNLRRKDALPQGNRSQLWTPILLDTHSFANLAGNFHIIREQLPLIVSEAMTIHKAQGQTYQHVAIYLSKGLTRALKYVAYSRVTSLEGLTIFGPVQSIVSNRVRGMSAKAKREEVATNLLRDEHSREMTRLRMRSNLMVDVLPFLSNRIWPTHYYMTLVIHNIRSFNRWKRACVEQDLGFNLCDVIMFNEMHTNTEEKLDNVLLDNYDCLSSTSRMQLNASDGQACFIRSDMPQLYRQSFVFLGDNSQQLEGMRRGERGEMSLFRLRIAPRTREKRRKQQRDDDEYSHVFICQVYKNRDMGEMAFYRELRRFLNSHRIPLFEDERDALVEDVQQRRGYFAQHLFVVGDFNIHYNEQPQSLRHMLRLFGLTPTMANEETFDRSRHQLDWCFTNVSHRHTLVQHQTSLYETWFSDHKPLILFLKFNLNVTD